MFPAKLNTNSPRCIPSNGGAKHNKSRLLRFFALSLNSKVAHLWAGMALRRALKKALPNVPFPSLHLKLPH